MVGTPEGSQDFKIQPRVERISLSPSITLSPVNASEIANNDAIALSQARTVLKEQELIGSPQAEPVQTEITNDVRETTTKIAFLREKVKTVARPIVTRAKDIGQRCKESLHTSQEWGDRLSQYFETQSKNLQTEINNRSMEWQSRIYQKAIPTQEAISLFLHTGAFEVSMKFLENAVTIQKFLPRLQALPIGGI